MSRKFIAVVLTLVLTVSMVFTANAGDDIDIDVSEGAIKTLSVVEMSGKYKTQGRTSIIGGNLSLDYTASGIEFNAYCKGDISVTFNVSNISTAVGGGVYFTILVDGNELSRNAGLITSTGEITLLIATGLNEGTHNVKIYRNTEIERATVAFKSVTLQGDLIAKPGDKALFVEFVGDSITTGFGNIYDASTGAAASAPINQDGTKTYAFLTAKQLNADFSMVAQQGIGAFTGWQPHNTITTYPKTRYIKDQTTLWDFSKQPNLVVINLGTNDMNRYTANGKTIAEVKAGFATLLALVRQKNPNAKIVWAHGMMTTAADNLIAEIISEAGGSDAGYYRVGLTLNNAGGGGHPNLAGHQTAANELVAFINNNVLEAPAYKAGDINGDDKVDLLDITVLSRHVAGWPVNVVAPALDVSGNGVVDLLDVTLLSRYVAGWGVTIK